MLTGELSIRLNKNEKEMCEIEIEKWNHVKILLIRHELMKWKMWR